MTLFAVVVVHGNIYEQPYLLDLITTEGTPIDTDQPRTQKIACFLMIVNVGYPRLTQGDPAMANSFKIISMDLNALRRLRFNDVWTQQGFLTHEEIRHIFQTCDGLWLHDGDVRRPHAELTSGKCSNGFVDVLRVLRFTNLCQLMADQLERRMREQYNGVIDWVVGSDHAGATLSFAVAATMRAQHDFTEKGPDKTQIWKRFEIKSGEDVLQVEELVTTTGTLQAVRDGIRKGNTSPVTFAPLTLCLVHRAPIYEFDGSPIVSLVHWDIQTWSKEECPLCATGSPRVRPKQNWAQLTGR